MAKKKTEKLIIWGVHPTGEFEDFLAGLANEFDIKGELKKKGGLTEITVTDTEKKINDFFSNILEKKPISVEIIYRTRIVLELQEFDDFNVDCCDFSNRPVVMEADKGICEDCIRELTTRSDKRFRHPFISCKYCGSRYTIMENMPISRENITFNRFEMCQNCMEEYMDLSNRRYQAHTNACNECGPTMTSRLNTVPESEKTELLKASSLLKEGRVIAYEGLGGMYLAANPFDEKAGKDLRIVKNRPTKQFAVMFKDIEEIKKYCVVSQTEENLLKSSARPVVLLERKSLSEMEDIKPRNYAEFTRYNFLGIRLPATALEYLLLEGLPFPVMISSANKNGDPIITDEKKVISMLENQPLITEAFFDDIKITTPMEDSAVRLIDGIPHIKRRARGYAPEPLYINECKGYIFAVGSQRNSAFALNIGPNVYISQYLGSLHNELARKKYNENVRRMMSFLNLRPEIVVCDMNPHITATDMAKSYAEEFGVRCLQVQHQHAHAAGVVAEHDLQGDVIGVVFDNTGYGTDDAIWGGEFLLLQGSRFERMSHFKYVDMIGGDDSMRNAYQSALSYEHAYSDEDFTGTVADDKFIVDLSKILDYADSMDTLEHREIEFTEKCLENRITTIKSSSVGKLFDGVAALLGIKDSNSFDDECGMLLEDAALRAIKNPGEDEVDDLALDFHMQMAEIVLTQCMKIREKTGCNQVVLSGSTFQNKVLIDTTLMLLRSEGFEPYFNISVSQNDEGLALGQLYICSKRMEEENGNNTKS